MYNYNTPHDRHHSYNSTCQSMYCSKCFPDYLKAFRIIKIREPFCHKVIKPLSTIIVLGKQPIRSLYPKNTASSDWTLIIESFITIRYDITGK